MDSSKHPHSSEKYMAHRISELLHTIQTQDERIKRLEAENANLKVENRSLIKSASMAISDKNGSRL